MKYDKIIMKFVETHAIALMRDPRFHSCDYVWCVGFEVLSTLLQHDDIGYSSSNKRYFIMGIKVIRSYDEPQTIKLYKEVI